MSQVEPRLSTLQQERSRVTREKLMRSAEQVWRTKGFDETTVSDVCQAAGVAKGTFYFYFPHKEDLLVELSLSTSGRVAEDIGPLLADDTTTEEVLRAAVESIARRVERSSRPLLARTLIELHRRVDDWQVARGDRADFQAVFQPIFVRARRRGEISNDFWPAELAAALAANIINGMLAWATERVGDMALKTVLWRRAKLVLNGAQAGLN